MWIALGALVNKFFFTDSSLRFCPFEFRQNYLNLWASPLGDNHTGKSIHNRFGYSDAAGPFRVCVFGGHLRCSCKVASPPISAVLTNHRIPVHSIDTAQDHRGKAVGAEASI